MLRIVSTSLISLNPSSFWEVWPIPVSFAAHLYIAIMQSRHVHICLSWVQHHSWSQYLTMMTDQHIRHIGVGLLFSFPVRHHLVRHRTGPVEADSSHEEANEGALDLDWSTSPAIFEVFWITPVQDPGHLSTVTGWRLEYRNWSTDDFKTMPECERRQCGFRVDPQVLTRLMMVNRIQQVEACSGLGWSDRKSP